MEKQVVVFGAAGMLGFAVSQYFSRRGYEVLALTRAEFDIAKQSHQELSQYLRPNSTVINCAGVIKPQIAKMTIEDVLRVNSIFPRNLAQICQERGLPCFHITTDCVYSGKTGNYDEKSLFDASDVYGMSKNAGEPSSGAMVLRTSIIGEEFNSSRSLLEWARSQSGKEVNGFTNHRWNGLTTVYLAEVMETILTKNLYKSGLFHIHSPNTVSKDKLLQIISAAYNLNLTVKQVAGPESCDRSMSSIFSLSKDICTKTIETQVNEMRTFFAPPEKVAA